MKNVASLSLILILAIAPFITSGTIPEAFAQSTLNVTSNIPCFLNYTGSDYMPVGANTTTTGLEMLQNCGFSDDYLSAVTLSFDWVTGGLFPMIVVTVLIIMTYVKYQNGLYPMAIGIMFLPFAAWAFPDQFLSYAVVLAAIIGAGTMVTIYIKRTKEYD